MIDGSGSSLGKLRRAAMITLVISMMAVFFLSLFLSAALAGTETGEFCPTCPDWTNLDGWLAQRDAYERAQANGGQQNGVQTDNNPPVAAAPAQTVSEYPNQEMLTSSHSASDGRVLLDVRTPEEYRNGHIPGARNLYWKDLQKSGSLDPCAAELALGSAGVNSSDRLVVYGGSDEGAFFAFWALTYLGQENVSLLDGGADSWIEGAKVETTSPSIPPLNYTLHIMPSLLVEEEDLDSLLGMADLQILDARDFVDYGRSKFTNSSIPLTADKIYEDGRIKDAATLEDLFDRRGLNDNEMQMVYGTPQAYSLFFGLRLMGYNATLLEGDWWQETEWAVSNVR